MSVAEFSKSASKLAQENDAFRHRIADLEVENQRLNKDCVALADGSLGKIAIVERDKLRSDVAALKSSQAGLLEAARGLLATECYSGFTGQRSVDVDVLETFRQAVASCSAPDAGEAKP